VTIGKEPLKPHFKETKWSSQMGKLHLVRERGRVEDTRRKGGGKKLETIIEKRLKKKSAKIFLKNFY
jgi:hypothetical protein